VAATRAGCSRRWAIDAPASDAGFRLWPEAPDTDLPLGDPERLELIVGSARAYLGHHGDAARAGP